MKCADMVVDENMVFGGYIQKYARYGSEPKSENGENTSVYATMWDGVPLPHPFNESRLEYWINLNGSKSSFVC